MEKEDEKMGEVKIESIKKKKDETKKLKTKQFSFSYLKEADCLSDTSPTVPIRILTVCYHRRVKGLDIILYSYITCFMLAAEREYFYEVVIHLPGR